VNRDFVELLAALRAQGVRFLVIGAHALAAHGIPRATGDLDVWVSMEPDNARRVWRALVDFGAPVDALDITPADFETRGRVVQLGTPPRRIDILTEISAVEFEDAWATRLMAEVEGMELAFLGRESLIKNKIASGRPKDLADVQALEG
jgi:hypothetical protein